MESTDRFVNSLEKVIDENDLVVIDASIHNRRKVEFMDNLYGTRMSETLLGYYLDYFEYFKLLVNDKKMISSDVVIDEMEPCAFGMHRFIRDIQNSGKTNRHRGKTLIKRLRLMEQIMKAMSKTCQHLRDNTYEFIFSNGLGHADECLKNKIKALDKSNDLSPQDIELAYLTFLITSKTSIVPAIISNDLGLIRLLMKYDSNESRNNGNKRIKVYSSLNSEQIHTKVY